MPGIIISNSSRATWVRKPPSVPLMGAMKVVALISGGKDSCYNMMQCVAAGHQIVALANLRPAENKEGVDELDSYMYQTVGHHAIDIYSEAMGLPLYRHTIKGASVDTGRIYTRCEGDEVEDLYHLLKLVKDKENVDAVSVGAILSDYQRVRVEDVCKRLALQPLAYLWRQDQETLLKEMISSNIQAIIIKVAAFGLVPDKHLGKTLDEMEPYLLELSKKYGVHICGEGGEYETFTLDCPLFKKKIVLDSSEVVVHSADAFAPVAYLRLLKLHLEDKASTTVTFSGKSLTGSCSCEIEEFEDNVWPSLEEQNENLCITWYSSGPTFQKSSKTFECSGKSLKGYQWITSITARLHPSEGDSVQESAKEVFSLLRVHLNSKGLELTDIILVHLYMKSMKDFAVINSVYMTAFDLCPPARVCLEAPLPEGMMFQMDCLAHKYGEMVGDVPCYQKQVMHIQSISHWAPANIGPYSQCIQIGDVLYCAGQIALVPCTMQLTNAGVEAEALLSLNHVEKVLKAMSHGAELHHILMANCYVTDYKYISVAQAAWQKKLRELKQAEDEDMNEPATYGEVAVVVVPFLPRAASVEWHVIAVVDKQQQREKLVLMRSLESCQIKCEAVQSHPTCTTAVAISLTLTSPSPSMINLDRVLHDMVAMFKQTIEKLSGACNTTPLGFRTFYQRNIIEMEALKAGLQGHLEEQMGKQAPALVLVPVIDLPGKKIIHVSCWVSP
ncbi:diphthine--ammonia ligase isoform X3 [Sceloporus undulatus]|uniref:diphthine--ammonia ligase isoform X3 n=1 Tax=Sceloporus undulatus TaxID=8520 RepID=UPI001C4B4DF2|nr:diphthine--ammonia ligase isoform X3 [Sceloporus undulatus]